MEENSATAFGFVTTHRCTRSIEYWGDDLAAQLFLVNYAISSTLAALCKCVDLFFNRLWIVPSTTASTGLLPVSLADIGSGGDVKWRYRVVVPDGGLRLLTFWELSVYCTIRCAQGKAVH